MALALGLTPADVRSSTPGETIALRALYLEQQRRLETDTEETTQ